MRWVLLLLIIGLIIVPGVLADLPPIPDMQPLPLRVAGAVLLTAIIELLVAYLFLLLRKKPTKVLISVLAVNVITVPFVWLISLPYGTLAELLVVETLVVAAEGAFILLLNKEHVSYKEAFILSVVMNVASFFLGLFSLVILYEITGSDFIVQFWPPFF